MGLFSKGGKLLIDGARLRGCCCEGWRLTAISYTRDREHTCCAPTITMPDPDEEGCIYGSLGNAAFDVSGRTSISAERICNDGLSCMGASSAFLEWWDEETGEAEASIHLRENMVAESYDITYTFRMSFTRCNA